jgi:hypothetical protein
MSDLRTNELPLGTSICAWQSVCSQSLAIQSRSFIVVEESPDLQLEKVAASARRLVGLVDAFFAKTVDALDAEGWNSGQTFALRAELVRIANCAKRAKHRGGTLDERG